MNRITEDSSVNYVNIVLRYCVCVLLFLLAFDTFFTNEEIAGSIIFLLLGFMILPFVCQKIRIRVPFYDKWIARKIIYFGLLSMAVFLRNNY
jgi:hypothetical protein